MPVFLFSLKRAFLPLLFLAILALPTSARADDAAVQTAWRLLDYIAVDYRGAVAGGRVISATEYTEMREFSASVTQRLSALPAHQAKARLVADARTLEAAVARMAAPDEVDRMARGLGQRLLAAYPVPLAPGAAPDLARGARLYAQHCASCHGATGRADTDAARRLDPPPIAFTDRARARDRSLFGLYQVIGQGLEGTAMTSFASLAPGDRWALAFYAGTLAYPEALARAGEADWRANPALRARIPDLERLVSITPAALGSAIGEDRAAALIAYLRAHPEAIAATGGSQALAVAHELLRQSLAAYRAGDRARATELALAAYLDGFEPVEALLSAREGGLVVEVEEAMGRLRAAIARGAPVEEVAAEVERIQSLYTRAEAALAPEAGSAASTFLGALAILLREGLEALLIVIAMIGFLRKAERRDMLAYVHIGWVGALVAGVATWWAASRFITISGAGRELTEGFGSLLAALILLFVGVWMHGKAQAGAWQAYVRDKLDKALTKGSAWFLAFLAFIAVYREVFETIIFFAAMGGEGNGGALIGGIAVGVALLALIAWAMLRLSARLPIGKFFQYSSVLIALLAVVLAGKGVAALQEAGMLAVHPLAGFPRSPLLGIYPTVETLLAQAAAIVLLVAGFLWTHRKAPKREPA
ncbi:MAG TPA: cytochrome c/FTR1 family iron permease [Allosphingosinicella sp.]|nr:cytochrome c/FTR1 family iron permease [Allosphingosinicella sp.]